MRWRHLGLGAEQVSRADLHCRGAQGQCRQQPAVVADTTGGNHRHADGIGHLRRIDGDQLRWAARADLVQRTRDGWNGAIGVQALERNFEAIGEEAFVPTVKIEEQGLYTVQRYDRDRYGFEGGLRYDRRTLSAVPLGETAEVERQFDNWSASGAALP